MTARAGSWANKAMMCVDASLAVQWAFRERHSDRALALLRDAIRDNQGFVAPHLLRYELTNVVRRYVVRGAVTPTEAAERLESLLRFPFDYTAPGDVQQRALSIAIEYDLPAAYDAHYLAVAEAHRCQLWTDDQRLLRNLAGRMPFVRSIEEYAE